MLFDLKDTLGIDDEFNDIIRNKGNQTLTKDNNSSNV